VGTPDAKGKASLTIFIVAIPVVVVALPEGLPLAVILALAFATTKVLRGNNFVSGNATSICSDKTGTLAEIQMTAVAIILDSSCSESFFYYRWSDSCSLINPKDLSLVISPPGFLISASRMIMKLALIYRPHGFAVTLSPLIKKLLLESIALSLTALKGE